MAIRSALLAAVVFEACTVLATQVKPIRAVSPWQDDPFDVAVSVAIFAVPVLACVIVLRLLVWRFSGSTSRPSQLRGAALTMVGICAGTEAFEWVALATGQHRSAWDGRTAGLVVGLVVSSALTALSLALLIRMRREAIPADGAAVDWLNDAVVLARRIPIVRTMATETTADWIRRHAMTVFVVVSVLGAFGVIGALAVSEGWTDPVLFGWMVCVETASNLAFCVLSNHVAGFIARPARSTGRRRTEAAVVVGCISVQVAIAFRSAIWQVVAEPSGQTKVGALVVLTLVAAVASGALTALVWRPREAPQAVR